MPNIFVLVSIALIAMLLVVAFYFTITEDE